MIVRERSNVSESPRKGPEWPPKSPLQAILSSPSGKRNHDERRRERPVSPSPIKRSFSPTKSIVAPLSVSSSDNGDEDEDEETLQLELKAIEAKLKLKKLRQAKAKQKDASSFQDDVILDARPTKKGRMASTNTEEDGSFYIQVPLSPPRERRPLAEPRSPARVMLGIDKGLRAQNVSLKRPASMQGLPHQSTRQAPVTAGRSVSHRKLGSHLAEAPHSKPKSFSERIAESRETDRKSQEKQDLIRQSRSKGFDHTARTNGRSPSPPKRLRRDGEDSAERQQLQQHSMDVKAQVAASSATRRQPSAAQAVSESAHLGPGLEPFSGIHLSSRKMRHQSLTKALSEKTLYPIPKLLKVVKAPRYEAPDVEGDYVVFGIIASKSSPRDHVGRKTTTSLDVDEDAKASGRHKFMCLRLTDLKWEVDLFLFDTAFSRFWKLTPGTVVAILNPGIMPPRRGREDTGMFALKLASSEDTMLEIGTAKDLGFCKSVKKDGQECGSWVNAKKTEFCEFHVNLQVEKARAGRMEVNSMVRFGARDKNSGEKYINSRRVSKDELVQNGLLPAGGRGYDAETQQAFYAVPSGRGAAANLLDEAEFGSKRERARLLEKRRKDREKDKDLAKRLGAIGNKAGGEYLRHKSGTQTLTAGQSTTQSRREEDNDAAVQGLLGRRATDVTLSPVHKRKRATGGGGGSSEPVGWGGAFKRGLLLSPKKSSASSHAADERSQEGSMSPRKRARFMLEDKGLREPGRDSFGPPLGHAKGLDDDDDDDDLDIVP